METKILWAHIVLGLERCEHLSQCGLRQWGWKGAVALEGAGGWLKAEWRESKNLGYLPEAFEFPWMQKNMEQFVSGYNLH